MLKETFVMKSLLRTLQWCVDLVRQMCWPARVQGFESFFLPSLHCRSAQSAHLGLGDPEEKFPTLLQKSQASTSTRTCGLFIPGSPNTLNASLSLTVMSFRSTSCNCGSKAWFCKALFPWTTQGGCKSKRPRSDRSRVHLQRRHSSLSLECVFSMRTSRQCWLQLQCSMFLRSSSLLSFRGRREFSEEEVDALC
jgi:hypothetical protein